MRARGDSSGTGTPGDSYHGIIVEESLGDPSVRTLFSTLGRRGADAWTLLRVSVEASRLPEVVERLQTTLREEGGIPFYAHFYRPGELIVVFPGAVFRITPDKHTWAPAVDHGESRGIPRRELDFTPCRFEDEVGWDSIP